MNKKRFTKLQLKQIAYDLTMEDLAYIAGVFSVREVTTFAEARIADTNTDEETRTSYKEEHADIDAVKLAVEARSTMQNLDDAYSYQEKFWESFHKGVEEEAPSGVLYKNIDY